MTWKVYDFGDVDQATGQALYLGEVEATDYEKPVYKSNTEKHKEQVQKAPPRDKPTNSDHTKAKPPKKEGS